MVVKQLSEIISSQAFLEGFTLLPRIVRLNRLIVKAGK